MANSGGTLIVEFLTGGHDYWQFVGDQLFSGTVEQPTLEGTGPFHLANGGTFELDNGDSAMGAFGLLAYFETTSSVTRRLSHP